MKRISDGHRNAVNAGNVQPNPPGMRGRLEGSQTSPRRLKLREATSGRPLYKMATLSVASGRLPGMTERKVLPIASTSVVGIQRPIELPHFETFPGAACC